MHAQRYLGLILEVESRLDDECNLIQLPKRYYHKSWQGGPSPWSWSELQEQKWILNRWRLKILTPNFSLFPFLGSDGLTAVRLQLIWLTYNQGPKIQAVPGNRPPAVKYDKYVRYIRFWKATLSLGQSMHLTKTVKYEPVPYEYK